MPSLETTHETSPSSELMIPVSNGAEPQIELDSSAGRLTLIARDVTLKDVLAALAETERLNIVCSDEVNTNITITLREVPLEDALTSIVSIAGCSWVRNRNIIHVTSLASTKKLAPLAQGRQVRVFHLDFAAGADLDTAIKGMLSPVGSSYVVASSTGDNRKANEALVVEDLPEYLPRVEQYIMQMDIPPRQVLIQVHVLSVELKDDYKHGVNYEHLSKFRSHTLSLKMSGMASPTAPQAFHAELSGGNVSGLIEALKTTTDAKTLASPRVLALNGQQSRIQVGQQLGFRVTTTTQTSTLETVEFLDVGVVLDVTPRITRDNHVLLKIKPKVSTGEINPDTQLPEEATSEVDTDVLLADNQGVVIGGLIQERDTNTQNKIPHFGDLKLIGSLFQRRVLNKERDEIIFVLVPHIIPYGCPVCCQESTAEMRAKTPLFQHGLQRTPRPWAPQLNDCIKKPVRWNQFFPNESPTPSWHGRNVNLNAPQELEILPPVTPVSAPSLDSQGYQLRRYSPHIVRLPPTQTKSQFKR